MNRLDVLLQKGFGKWQGLEETPTPKSNGCFRGGNITMLEGDQFVAEDSSNCPRAAIARFWGFEEPKNTSSHLSHSVGHNFEKVFEKVLSLGGSDKMVVEREEEVQILVEVGGVVRYTQRPDAVVTEPGSPTPFGIETKSVQSGNTAEMVFHNSTPKLGAVMQLAGVMLYHVLDRGFVVYGLQTYLSHYSYKQKKKLSFSPAIKTFECSWLGETLMLDGRKTIVKQSMLRNGLQMLCDVVDDKAPLPNKPKWVNLWGDVAKYEGCNYCTWKECCKSMDDVGDSSLVSFREQLELKGGTNEEGC